MKAIRSKVMLQAVKVRLYPDNQQKESLAKAFGSTRWLWNHLLELTNKTYKETGKGISRFDMNKMLPELKEKHQWLKQTYSQCLQAVTLNLSRAFINFFENRSEYPSFKSKHSKQSLAYPQNVKVFDSSVKFPFIGEIDAVLHRPIEGKVKTVTITKTTTDEYYASILVDNGKEIPAPSSDGKAIGIDVGLTHFAITSEGSKYDHPRWLEKHEKNLKQKQKDLSRKQKGSKNRNKARRKVLVSRSFRHRYNPDISVLVVIDSQILPSKKLIG